MKNEIKSTETKKNLNYHWFRYGLENSDGLESTVDVYQPRPKRNDRKWIVLHPILTGDNEVTRVMANYFATVNRWNVAILHRGDYPFEANTPDGVNQALEAIFEQHKSLANWLERYYDLDPKKIISMGTSMGGIANAQSASQLPYAGYVSIVGGCDVLDIMSTSQMDTFKEWRARQKKNYGPNYYAIYKNVLTHDISDLHSDPDNSTNYLTVIALFDKIVPTKTQKRLKKLYNCRAIYTPTGHKYTAIALMFLLPVLSVWSAYTFFKESS